MCVLSVWRNGINCKFIFLFLLKNSARKVVNTDEGSHFMSPFSLDRHDIRQASNGNISHWQTGSTGTKFFNAALYVLNSPFLRIPNSNSCFCQLMKKCIYTTDKKACHKHVSGKHNGNTWLLQLAWHQPETNHYLIKRNTILNFK